MGVAKRVAYSLTLFLAAYVATATAATLGAPFLQPAFPSPASLAARAQTQLQGEPSNPQLAQALTLKQLEAAPADGAAWARLAFIEAQGPGRLTEPALRHLQRSFAVAPLDPELMPWRVRFALEHWADLSPSMRRAVVQQFQALSYDWEGRQFLRRAVAGTQDPAGRLAGALLVSAMDRKEAAEAKTP